jgi:hypothetical protein
MDKSLVAKSSELQVHTVNVLLGPKGIEVDAAGRIRFVNPEILQAIIAARPTDLSQANDNNTYACGANVFQCGK